MIKLNKYHKAGNMKKDMDDTHLHACGELLIKNKLTIAFAESATAGRIF